MVARADRIRVSYCAEADSLDIHLAKRKGRVGTLELAADISVDLDEAGRLVGVEILNASRFYDRQMLSELAIPSRRARGRRKS